MDGQWGHNYGPPQALWKPCSPSPSTIALLLATADPANSMTGMNFTGRVTPDMLNSMRRSRTRSIGNPNSPDQFSFNGVVAMGSPGLMAASPLSSFGPLSAGAGLHSRSPRALNAFRPPSAASHVHSRSPFGVPNFRTPPIPAHRAIQAPAGQKSQASARGHRFKSSQWESYKAKIKELFMDEDKSLDETMRTMEQDFSFNPTRKQYSNKLKQWGFIKYISGSTANWMVNKAKVRKREGKETEFTVGDQPWPIDRIERSAKRTKIEGTEAAIIDHKTPPDVRYGTPSKELHTISAPLNPSSSHPERWTPFFTPQTITPTYLRLQWNGKSKADLEVIHRDAQRLASIGKIQEAEDGYLQVLGGFQALLLPTHTETNSVAYELAEFYAQNDRMEDADKVLDWMGEKHLERWLIGHKNVRTHLIKVADMLQSWSREDDAISIISRAADSYEQSVKSPYTDLEPTRSLQNNHAHLMRDELRLPRIGRGQFSMNDDEDDEVRMDYRVRLAIARANAEDDGAESILLKLCEQCERHPAKLAIQILEARGALIKLYKNLEWSEKFDSALNQIQGSFWKVFKSDVTKTELLLDTAIELITWLVKGGRDEAAALLKQVQVDAVDTFGEDDQVTISVLIRIGIVLQEQDRWVDARPRFEQALAASMTRYGMDCMMTTRLEEALYQKSYVASLPKSEDIRRQGHISRWNSKTLGHAFGCGGTGLLWASFLSGTF